ncbi:MAG: SpoIIE family protein phosphatase [Candidatus Latescibacterota bacterium]|nr:MAG: SpoIIE family protein phosphatase [Candidatus Latescibacterota bacterium]
MALFILIPAAYALYPVLWNPLDYRFYNYFHSRRAVPLWTDVVVVGIDEATRDEVFTTPVYPLSRHVDQHAAVTRQLKAAGARAIVFDLRLTENVFDEPPVELANAFRDVGNVHLVMSLLGPRGVGSLPKPSGSIQGITPHPDLIAASAGVHVADVRIDPDGVLRRFYRNPRLKRLGLETISEHLSAFEFRDAVPIEFPSETEPMPLISYRDVFTGRVNVRPLVEEKIAFVGSVLDESTDYVTVPRLQYHNGNERTFLLPGVSALAAMTQTLIREGPIRDAPWSLALLWNVAWCFLAVTIMPRRKPFRGAFYFLIVVLVSLFATGLFHVFAGLVFPAGLLVGCFVFAGVYAVVERHLEAEKKIIMEEAEVQRVRRELETARRTQERFLPKTIPNVTGYDIWGINVSSREVSGDYFDVIDPGDDQPLIVAIADVSGKGLPAALLMSNVQAALHSHILEGDIDIGRAAGNLNKLICENTDDESFVTMFIGEIEKDTRALRYVRAGHDEPYVVSGRGKVKTLDMGGLMLGFIPETEYPVGEITLEPDDILCMYTDGVTEARNRQDEEFQTDRLKSLLKDHRDKNAKQIVDEILSGVTRFSETESQADDVTLLVVRMSN